MRGDDAADGHARGIAAYVEKLCEFARGGEGGARFDEDDGRGVCGEGFRDGHAGGGIGGEHPAGAGHAGEGLADADFFENDKLIGKLLQCLGRDACGVVGGRVGRRRDVYGETARRVGGGGPVVLEEKGEGLLEVEQVGGRCAGDEEGFGEFPLHLLGDFAGDGVGGEVRGEGDFFCGERGFKLRVLTGLEEGGTGGGCAEMFEVGGLSAERDGAGEAGMRGVDGECGGEGVALSGVGELPVASGFGGGDENGCDAVEGAAAGIAAFVF